MHKTNIASLTVVIIVFVVAVGLLIYKGVSQKPTIAPQPLYANQPTIALDSSLRWKEYTDTLHNFSIKYPESWKFNKVTFVNGEGLHVANGSDQDSGTTTSFTISKNGWVIEMAIKPAMPDENRGVGPTTSLSEYRFIPAFGRNMLRSKVEDGVLPFVGADYPYAALPLTILFQRLENEVSTGFPQPDAVGSYILLFDANNLKKTANISIVVNSSQLTEQAITEKKLDRQILKEIDQILSTCTFK